MELQELLEINYFGYGNTTVIDNTLFVIYRFINDEMYANTNKHMVVSIANGIIELSER